MRKSTWNHDKISAIPGFLLSFCNCLLHQYPPFSSIFRNFCIFRKTSPQSQTKHKTRQSCVIIIIFSKKSHLNTNHYSKPYLFLQWRHCEKISTLFKSILSQLFLNCCDSDFLISLEPSRFSVKIPTCLSM